MKVKNIFISFLVFFMAFSAFAASPIEKEAGEIRNPDSQKRREDDNCAVIIQANVEAELYLNGKLIGKTPYAATNLDLTVYTLELRKNGYDSIKCKIYPRKRYTFIYYFELQKSVGYINIKNAPSGAMIYIDGSRHTSFPAEVSPGGHTVKARKFGYEDFSEYVSVENHRTTSLSISLEPAPFKIKNFKVSRTTINPDYSSGMGRVNFTFDVTNDGSALLTVSDRYDNEVWTHNFSSFSTWNQSVTWDGSTGYGDSLPDGQYTVNLSGENFNESYKITIDRSLIYPLSVFTPAGSGIGSLPCAFGDGVSYTKVFVNFGGIFNVDSDQTRAQCFPVSAGIVLDFLKYNELTASAGTYITGKNETNPVEASVSFKRNFTFDLDSGMKFNFAPLLNYDFCSAYTFGALGSNTGTGLGVGLAAAFETKVIYFGLTGQYSFGKTRIVKTNNSLPYDPTDLDVLKYGAAASFVPWQNLKTSLWTACYNNKLLEAGAEVIAMPGSSSFCCDAKVSLMTDLSTSDKNMLINAKFGLSYLF